MSTPDTQRTTAPAPSTRTRPEVAGMIDTTRIAEEAQHFFEWPDPTRKDHVTLTSCVIFAATISEMARADERERIAAWLATQRNGTPAQGIEFAAALRACGPNVRSERPQTAAPQPE